MPRVNHKMGPVHNELFGSFFTGEVPDICWVTGQKTATTTHHIIPLAYRDRKNNELLERYANDDGTGSPRPLNIHPLRNNPLIVTSLARLSQQLSAQAEIGRAIRQNNIQINDDTNLVRIDMRLHNEIHRIYRDQARDLILALRSAAHEANLQICGLRNLNLGSLKPATLIRRRQIALSMRGLWPYDKKTLPPAAYHFLTKDERELLAEDISDQAVNCIRDLIANILFRNARILIYLRLLLSKNKHS